MRSQVCLASLICTLSFSAVAQDPLTVSVPIASPDIVAAPSKTYRSDKRLDWLLAPIKSESDLQNYLDVNYLDQTPFAALSEFELAEFADSLEFNDSGVTSLNTSVLANLSVTQTYQLLSLVGLQSNAVQLAGFTDLNSQTDTLIIARTNERSVLANIKDSTTVERASKGQQSTLWFGDYPTISDGEILEGYQCVSQGSCFKSKNWACTSNC